MARQLDGFVTTPPWPQPNPLLSFAWRAIIGSWQASVLRDRAARCDMLAG